MKTIGITDNRTKNLINLAQTLWGFVNATVLALTVSRFKRRTVYLVRTRLLGLFVCSLICHKACTISLLVVFTGWTIASARYAIDKSEGASRAVIAYVIFFTIYNENYANIFYRFIFLYSPCYNLAYNALTYSKPILPRP